MTSLCALLYAAATAVLLSIALAFANAGLSPRVATFSLACGAAVASYTFWSHRDRRPNFRPLGPWEWAALIAYALFSLRAFLWLVFSTGDEIRVLSVRIIGTTQDRCSNANSLNDRLSKANPRINDHHIGDVPPDRPVRLLVVLDPLQEWQNNCIKV